MTTTHLIFEAQAAGLDAMPSQPEPGRSEPTSPTKRTSLPLAEVARAEKFAGRLTRLDNALRLEML